MALLKKLEEAGFQLPNAAPFEGTLDGAAVRTPELEKRVVMLSSHPVDEIWKAPARPPLPNSEVYVHSKVFAGAWDFASEDFEERFQGMRRFGL